MSNPLVSVLMPVYNGEKYLREAIDSILNQSFKDFELLVIDDGSKDSSKEIIASFCDPRIKFRPNEKNLGLPSTLNRGIDLTAGKYIVRMDQDDISLPTRIEKQVAFMESHPEIGICGTWIKVFGIGDYVDKYPVNSDLIKASMFFYNPLAHPTVIMRKELLNQHGLRYSTAFLHAEDYELWQRASQVFPLYNIPEVLLRYRTSPTSYCRALQVEQNNTLRDLDKRALTVMKIAATEENLRNKAVLRSLDFASYEDSFDKLYDFLVTSKNSNKLINYYPEPAFSEAIERRWLIACNSLAQQGLKAWSLYNRGGNKGNGVAFKETTKFFLKCLKYEIKRAIKSREESR